MGDNEIKSNTQKELSSYTEIFEENCPFFMSIGMSYNQFWYEDCWIAKTYLKTYKIKKEQLNEQFWLQGMYIYEALCDVSPVLHAFSKKGTKPIPYPKEPYPLEKKEKIVTEEEKELEKEKAIQFFKNWSKSVAKRFNNKK